MSLPAVLLEPGVHVLHQQVPLQGHVREGGAREHPHNLQYDQKDGGEKILIVKKSLIS